MTSLAPTRIPIAQPMLDDEEKRAVLAVLDSGHLVQGPVVADLEQKFAEWCGVKHAVAVSSGTAALHLALFAHGIGPGDEVITSSLTFVASANAALFVGARPVFVDIDPDTFCLDPNLVEAAITPRTRVLLPVHLYGHPAPMPKLREIAERHGLLVIEDAAQAHGGAIDGQKVGGFGDVAAFSLYPSKNMTAGEGGLLTTNDDDLSLRLRLARDHGSVGHYRHESLGYNFRMSDLHAAIGRVQLRKLGHFNTIRQRNANFLTQRLREVEGIVPPTVSPGYTHVYHQYTVRIPDGRDVVQQHLSESGIEARVYYPSLVHEQPYYQSLGYAGIRLPQAERARAEILSLPIHPALTETDLVRIFEGVWQSVRRGSTTA